MSDARPAAANADGGASQSGEAASPALLRPIDAGSLSRAAEGAVDSARTLLEVPELSRKVESAVEGTSLQSKRRAVEKQFDAVVDQAAEDLANAQAAADAAARQVESTVDRAKAAASDAAAELRGTVESVLPTASAAEPTEASEDAPRQMPETNVAETPSDERPGEMPSEAAGESGAESNAASAIESSRSESDVGEEAGDGESSTSETAALTAEESNPAEMTASQEAAKDEEAAAEALATPHDQLGGSPVRVAEEPSFAPAAPAAKPSSEARLRRVLTVLGWRERPYSALAANSSDRPTAVHALATDPKSRIAPALHRQAGDGPAPAALAAEPDSATVELEAPVPDSDEPSRESAAAPQLPAVPGSGAGLIESVTDEPAPDVSATRLRTPAVSTRLQDRPQARAGETLPSESSEEAQIEVSSAAPGAMPPGPASRLAASPAGRRAAVEVAQAPAATPAAPPAASDPFEVIEQSGEIKVTLRRSKLLKLKLDVYRIAIVDPNICDVIQFTPHELSIVGKSVGATHVTFWFDDGNQRPVTYLVTVEPDIRIRQQIDEDFKKLESMINELFPDSYVRLVPMADKVIVKGQARDAEEAAQILALLRSQTGGGQGGAGFGMMNMGIASGFAANLYSEQEVGNAARPRVQIVNMLRVPGVHQVALRVKIAELNRTAARDFGVGIGGTVNFTSNPKGSQLFIQSMLGLASGGTAGGAAAPTFLAQFDGDDIRVGIRYMQKAGVLRLLSEPTLVTLSGQPATFVAGGEFAVPTLVGSVGLNAVTTDFRSYGALIAFVPTVVDKDRIRLQVSPEFSQINTALTNTQTGTPGLNVRAVTTTVEMREGQTFAIAGLLEDTMKSASGSDMPFLHKIFGAREVSRTETELIILVTPELVHPMDPEEVPPLPGFDVTEPSNHQFYLKGDIEGTPTRDWRHTVWPRLRQRYNAGGSSMISGPFGHGQ